MIGHQLCSSTQNPTSYSPPRSDCYSLVFRTEYYPAIAGPLKASQVAMIASCGFSGGL